MSYQGTPIVLGQPISGDLRNCTAATTSVAGIMAASDKKIVTGYTTDLTDGATIIPDFSAGPNFREVLGGNRTLGVPINVVQGQGGIFSFYQDATGNRTLAYVWAWQFSQGTSGTLATNGLAIDQYSYNVNQYATATITMTIAAPCVVSWTAHGLVSGDRVQFTTTGALPTGLSINTTYWITKIDANSFNVSTTKANAAAGTYITTTGSQSGVHTAVSISITLNFIPNII